MKLNIIKVENSGYEPDGVYTIEIDGEKHLEISESMEPEDVTFNRDLAFVKNIPELMRSAWEAGKKGEDFLMSYKDMTQDEYYG